MILLLDLGNTRLKWAQAHSRDDWSDIVEVEAADDAAWHNTFYALPRPQRVLACSVGQPHIRDFLTRAVFDVWSIEVEWLSVTREALGVENRYRVLAQQGPDRWAAVLGARSLFPDEALTAYGVYLCGSIQPCYRLMKQSLFQGTARLPLADGYVHDYPTSTEDAIETGCLSALTGSIEAMFLRLTGRAEEPRLLLTGGDAPRLSQHLKTPHQRVENLVLHGLAALAFSDIPTHTEPDA